MYRYTISGIPATKMRTMGKSHKAWDEYAAARMHAENELIDQIDIPHQGLLLVDYLFYVPHTKSSFNRAKRIKELYADNKPPLSQMTHFAEMMCHEFLLAADCMIVSYTSKKFYAKIPGTVIFITPIYYK